MQLPPFLLDQWLNDHHFAPRPLDYDLGSSTGPVWTLAELLALDPSGGVEAALSATPLVYAHPKGSDPLRAGIAAFHGVGPEDVMVTTGASEALSAAFCLAAEPEAAIVLPDPAYPAMPALARAWGYQVRPYRLPRDRGYRMSAALVLDAIDARTRLVVVNTPHNPTGAVFPRDELRALATETSRRGILLLVDEVYHGIYHAARVESAASLDADLIVVGDASKALPFSGLRVGWIVDRNPRRRERLLDLRSYFTVSNAPISETLGALVLANRDRILARGQEVARTNLDRLHRFFVDVSDQIA